MRIEDIKKPISEMAKQARVCDKCGKTITGNHYWYKGEWKCKGGGASTGTVAPTAPTPTATPSAAPASAAPAPTASAPAPAPAAKPAPAAASAATDTQKITKWLDDHKIQNFSIQADGSVNVGDDKTKAHVRLVHYDKDKLPVKFGVVTGDFICSIGELTTMENGPTETGGDCMVDHCRLESFAHMPVKVGGNCMVSGNENISSLEGLPREIGAGAKGGSLYLEHLPKITTLHNIHKVVRLLNGELHLNSTPIKSNILGVMMIRGLTKIDGLQGGPLQKAQEIINSHLKGERDVHMCQEDLIQAGFEEAAEL